MRSASQSIPDDTTTAVTFQSEVYDEGGWIAVSSTTITVPAGAIPAGYTTVIVDVEFTADFATDSTGRRQAIPYKNGVALMGPGTAAATGQNTWVLGALKTTAEAGDEFTMDVYQNSGGSLDLLNVSLAVAVYRPLS